MTAEPKLTARQLPSAVRRELDALPITDVHTHIYDPALGPVLLWGLDELLTYHYLVAEVFRCRPEMATGDFWALSKTAQADLIWDELFVKRSPLSEACRGVLTALISIGLDPHVRTLAPLRRWFAKQNARDYVDLVFDKANLRRVYMTNDPFDPAEAPGWAQPFARDPRFLGVLRLDSALMNWPEPAARLAGAGFRVEEALSGQTIAELRRYLNVWCDRFEARYMAISLPPSFRYPAVQSPLTNLLVKAVLPVAEARGIPLAMMIGVRKLVNPALRLAGDSLGVSDVETVEQLARDFPKNRFLITMLARENMHGLCIAARKFANILPFGCWWFLNNPSLIDEITRMRLELLGLSFVPQHSDARVLDQLLYKWSHSRAIIAGVLSEKYAGLLDAGWAVTRSEIRRDLGLLLDVAP